MKTDPGAWADALAYNGPLYVMGPSGLWFNDDVPASALDAISDLIDAVRAKIGRIDAADWRCVRPSYVLNGYCGDAELLITAALPWRFRFFVTGRTRLVKFEEGMVILQVSNMTNALQVTSRVLAGHVGVALPKVVDLDQPGPVMSSHELREVYGEHCPNDLRLFDVDPIGQFHFANNVAKNWLRSLCQDYVGLVGVLNRPLIWSYEVGGTEWFALDSGTDPSRPERAVLSMTVAIVERTRLYTSAVADPTLLVRDWVDALGIASYLVQVCGVVPDTELAGGSEALALVAIAK